MSKFVHLHTHSHYSLLDGLGKVPQLLDRAKELGMDAMALTDHGVLYGAIEFYKAAKKRGIKPILGVETYVAPGSRFDREASAERYYHLVLLAENVTGWKNLVKLITKSHLEGFYYKPRIDKEILREHAEGLIGLAACLGGEVNRALMERTPEEAERIAREYEEILGKGNFYLELQHHPHIPETVTLRERAIALAKRTGIPLVATHDIHYVRPEDSEYHDILLAVQTGNRLTDDDRLTLKADNFAVTSPEEMAEWFKDVPEAVANTVKIAARCAVEFELKKVRLPHFPKPKDMTAMAYIRKLIDEGLPKRFSKEKLMPVVHERLEYELGVIEKTGFADYFLIVADLITWAKTHGIAVGPGRGSAAGSLISYVLGITDVNPLDYDLLFERFLNPSRNEMPDIDIDFADTRRDEVLAYAREKYGADHVAQIITFGTMAARAAIRDAGRAMGLTYGFCDQLAKLIPFNMGIAEAIQKTPELAELRAQNEDAKKLLDAAEHLEGVARHASVHACGTVISEEPLTELVPLQLAPQDKENAITQFEMHSIEDLGLLKIDFLGLKNLTIIEDTVRLVKELRGEDVTISELPLDDKATYELLKAGDTTGVFQFESSGMRRYMKEIDPNRLEDLIALVALFRPGPMELIPSYLKRRRGEERVTYLHPKLKPILENTYGIGVYQEQMMRIARDLAGFSLSEADTLRKAIGKKIKELLDEQKEKLIDGMVKNGIDVRTATEIWELFPPFARYGFNKSHATCYALIGYRTAYLKAHYPEEFFAALLNADSGDVERIAVLVGEARQEHVDVLPPDVNASAVRFAPEGERIRFGLLAIKNVGEHIADVVIEERARRGPYKDFVDFLTRIQDKDLNKKSLESLAKAGVFDSLGVERNAVLANMDDIVKFNAAMRKDGLAVGGSSLFGAQAPAATLKLKPGEPATAHDRLLWEKELLGFYLSDHPLNAHKEKVAIAKARSVAEALAIKNEHFTFRIAGCVSQMKKIVTKSGQPMLFATLEDNSGQSIEAIVFNSAYAKTADSWVNGAVVLVEGHISLRNDEKKFVVEKAKRL